MTTTNGDVFKACAIKICLTRVDNIEKYKKHKLKCSSQWCAMSTLLVCITSLHSGYHSSQFQFSPTVFQFLK